MNDDYCFDEDDCGHNCEECDYYTECVDSTYTGGKTDEP